MAEAVLPLIGRRPPLPRVHPNANIGRFVPCPCQSSLIIPKIVHTCWHEEAIEMAIVKKKDIPNILIQLANQTGKVDHNLLLPPKCRASPGIGLVASYERTWQFVAIDFSWGGLIRQILAGLGAVLVIVFSWLIAWDLIRTLQLLSWMITTDVERPQVIVIVIVIVALWIPLSVSTAFLNGKVSLYVRNLDLDLNGIYHLCPQGGRCYTEWSKITSIQSRSKKSISLYQANGDILIFWVSCKDRKKLSKLIPGLIRRHRP